jgi:hypothetical protein
MDKLESFCQRYNIPLDYLAEILNDSKVIPMIRGKAFEFSVMLRLNDLLGQSDFEVLKLDLNPQLTIHDEDLTVHHKPSGRRIRLECKLAAKGKYQKLKDGSSQISVKCMRSRTLGEDMVKRLAPLWGVSEASLKVHNDQYLSQDFDLVITSIGNAFYETNEETGIYEWQPSDSALAFLDNLAGGNTQNLKDFAFNRIYLARSKYLTIHPDNHLRCTRKKCPSPNDCGFIPNYPLIHFPEGSNQASWPWVALEDSLSVFQAVVDETLAAE